MDHIFELENYLIEKVLLPSIKSNSNSMHYFRDTYSLIPADRIDTEHTMADIKDDDVVTVSSMYKHVNRDAVVPIEFVRVPINDVPNERVPELGDFDYLVETVCSKVDKTTAVHCNCQMGRGRTTTGMFICALIMSKSQHKTIDVQLVAKKEKTCENGYYSFVRELIKLWPEAENVKLEIDAMMDLCDHLINMRQFIWKCKTEYENESGKGNQSRADFWRNLAINYVERYVYFILFGMYLTENFSAGSAGEKCSTFKTWCGRKDDLFVKVIGRKPGQREDIDKINSLLGNFKWD